MPLPTRRNISMLDLKVQHAPIREELLATITRIMDAQQFIMGEEVRGLEEEIAAYCDVAHAVGCASGSDALYLSLIALGIGPGDAVLTTPFTFFATAGSITKAGAKPVFVDIEPETFNIDPARLAEALERHPDAKAIIPVHLYGGCAEMDPILEAAAGAGCPVIEDAAQSIGAEHKGRRAMGMGVTGCLSFFPSKNLGGIGDGGMVTTNDAGLAAKLASLRVHGETEQYHHRWVGTNSRLDAIQAAVLRVKLKYLDQWTGERQRIAGRYRQALGGAGLPLKLPPAGAHQTRHVYNQFVIRFERRDELRAYLGERGVDTQVYYPIPLHLQKCFRFLGYREGDLPVSEQACREVLAMPVASGVNDDDVDYICDLIRSYYG